jgi:hypothetical protein
MNHKLNLPYNGYHPIFGMSQVNPKISSGPYKIQRYYKVVTSIGRTIEIPKAIDEIFSEVEKETIDFELQNRKL